MKRFFRADFRTAALVFFLAFFATHGLAHAVEKDFWTAWYEEGSTEPGSSGSSLLNKDGRVIGQLTGGNASCANVGNQAGFDIYGKFNVSWTIGLKEIFDPDGTATETDTTLAPVAKAASLPPLPPGAALRVAVNEARVVRVPPEDMRRARADFARLVESEPADGHDFIGTGVEPPPMGPSDWTRLDAGGRVSWRLALRAEGALALRLLISDIPTEWVASAFVYSPDAPESARLLRRDAATAQLPFWSAPVPGDTVILEIVAETQSPPDIGIDRISCRLRGADSFPDALFKVGSCYTDVNCESNWALEKMAVGEMEFLVDAYGNGAVCTGSLIMDGAASFTPYFLSANHCFDTQYSADSLIVTFFYFTDACDGVEPPWQDVLTFTQGSRILHSSHQSDDLLLSLTPPLPPGVAFLGWTILPPTFGDPITVIHHPSGTVMRITHGFLLGESENLVFGDDDISTDDDTVDAPSPRGNAKNDKGGSGCGCGQ